MSLNPFTSEAPEASLEGVVLDSVASVVATQLDVPLDSISVARLAGDASSRVYFRALWPAGSIVAVRYPRTFSEAQTSGQRLDDWCRERPSDGAVTFANDPVSQIELSRLLPQFGVPVPTVLAVAEDQSILLLDDKGDDLLQSWLRGATLAEKDVAYERAVDLIANVRAATEGVAGTDTAAARLAFDAAKLGWELEFFRVNCFERYLHEPLDTDLYLAVQDECRQLAEALASRPRFLCHRDYHARNLMLAPARDLADGVFVIDYQDARMGPLTYDIVSLLEDPYVPLDPSFRARMCERFVERLHYEGAWPGADSFREEYDLMTVQRLLKAVGTYTNQAAVRGKDTYVPYIEPALREAKIALDRLCRFAALRRAIERIV